MVNNYIWANAYWYFFHILSNNLKEEKLNTKSLRLIHTFINSLILSIPCEKCKVDTYTYFQNNDFKNIKTKNEFIHFFYNFHNYVNRKVRKNREDFKVLNNYRNLNITYYLSIIDKVIFRNRMNRVVYRFFHTMTHD